MLGTAGIDWPSNGAHAAVGQNGSTLDATTHDMILDAKATAQRLAYPTLVGQIRELLADPSVQVPDRLVQSLPGGGSLFVMPALDARIAMTKLITFAPGNAEAGQPTIQGDVLVFDVRTGERRLMLDGPTVTARRTAAVSLVAAQALAPNPKGPLLVVGAGVQGHAHVEAFVEVLGVREVLVASRSQTSARALAEYARSLGAHAAVAPDADAAMKECPLVVTCTPAKRIVLTRIPRADAFIAAVGAFTPGMAELAPALCRHCASEGIIVVDTPQGAHETGDLLQAGLDAGALATLGEIVSGAKQAAPGPVLFKSCGWAGWDLAAARAALA